MINENDYNKYSNKAIELGKRIGGFIQYLKSKIQQ